MTTVKYFGRDVPIETAQQIHLAKRRLESRNEKFRVLVSELERLQTWANKLVTDTPITSPHVPGEYFLQMMSVHILIVALLEFAPKCVGKLSDHRSLLNYLRNSPVLNELEADWLIHTVLTRHTLVHNFGRYDSRLAEQEKKYIRKLKIVWPEEDSFLTTKSLEQSLYSLRLLEKFVFLDVFSKELTKTERQAFEQYHATR